MLQRAAALNGRAGAGDGMNDLVFHPVSRADADCKVRTNGLGEFVDVWGTPYEVRSEGPGRLAIRSAGADGQFGDADDIVYDSVANSFVNP
jgi:hypothetical protein